MKDLQRRWLFKKLVGVAPFLLLLLIIFMTTSNNQSQIEDLKAITIQQAQLIKSLEADKNINKNDIEELRKIVLSFENELVRLDSTRDEQATRINVRIDELELAFEEVSAQRLFISEDE